MRVAVRRFPALLLDTCVLVDAYRQRTGVLAGVPVAARQTSVFALWEFLRGTRGASLSGTERTQREKWLARSGITVPELRSSLTTTFLALLRLDESPPALPDCLIAADCLSRSLPLVTSNVRHFVSVRGLRVVPTREVRYAIEPTRRGSWSLLRARWEGARGSRRLG